MTALEKMRKKSAEFTRLKIEAQKNGIDTIQFPNCNGDIITFYFHSGRWNDRPASVGKYKGI